VDRVDQANIRLVAEPRTGAIKFQCFYAYTAYCIMLRIKVPIDKALIVLPRTQLDDMNFLNMKLNAEQVHEILNYDLDLTVRSGALRLLSVHSQTYIEEGLMMRTMGEYVRKVSNDRDRLWVARGDEIASWRSQREAVQVEQSWKQNGLQVSLKNTNTKPVANIAIFLTLPGKHSRVKVEAIPLIRQFG
jgi:hypothetical protein